MKMVPACVLMVHLAAGMAQAQTFGEVQIQLGVYSVGDDGGEKPFNMWRSTGPVVIGKLTTSTFSVGDSCDQFSVSSAGELHEGATTAWKIETTPIRVVGNAVTFRLRWGRVTALRQQLDQLSLGSGKAPALPGDDLQLTLRPGESWSLDTIPVPAGKKTVHGQPCWRASSIRVSVDNYPSEPEERRLIAADLWLVERLADGTEAPRSQPLAIRGLPNRPFPFYFDSIVDGKVTLDIYGTLISRLETGALAMTVDTRSRWPPGSPYFAGPQRSVTSNIQVKPEETVELRLPLLGGDAGPFAKRAFSIKIRARQLR